MTRLTETPDLSRIVPGQTPTEAFSQAIIDLIGAQDQANPSGARISDYAQQYTENPVERVTVDGGYATLHTAPFKSAKTVMTREPVIGSRTVLRHEHRRPRVFSGTHLEHDVTLNSNVQLSVTMSQTDRGVSRRVELVPGIDLDAELPLRFTVLEEEIVPDGVLAGIAERLAHDDVISAPALLRGIGHAAALETLKTILEEFGRVGATTRSAVAWNKPRTWFGKRRKERVFPEERIRLGASIIARAAGELAVFFDESVKPDNTDE